MRFFTAGESHGPALLAFLSEFPAGLTIDTEFMQSELRRRRSTYGRGPRQARESDRVRILSGLYEGATTGAPIALLLDNQVAADREASFLPRSGHADLVGYLKYNLAHPLVPAERASARETAARVAAGAICKQLLALLGCRFYSITRRIGSVLYAGARDASGTSPLLVGEKQVEERMRAAIDEAAQRGDSLDGSVEVCADSPCPGLGSYCQWDKRLDGKLGQAMLSIPAVKGITIGSQRQQEMDAITYDKRSGYGRASNILGGLEAGVTTGRPIRMQLLVKAVPTVGKGRPTVDVLTKQPGMSPAVRADTCIVPTVGVIAEAMAAIVLARTYLTVFGGDTVADIQARHAQYVDRLRT